MLEASQIPPLTENGKTMHTIIGMLNKYAHTLALTVIVLTFCSGSVWAQNFGGGEGGGEGWELVDTTGGEGGGEGWERLMDGGEGGGEGWERPAYMPFTISGTIEQPTESALLGNYPNPFNPETTIRFEIQAAQQVRLSVFNVLGQRVQVLVDGQVAAGRHEARFEAYGLPSGTYFTRLETATGVSTGTMVLTQ